MGLIYKINISTDQIYPLKVQTMDLIAFIVMRTPQMLIVYMF